MKIKVKYSKDTKEEYKLKNIKQGDWIDLYVHQDTLLEPNKYKAISLGVAMELPEDYTAYVVPRSSTFKKYKCLQANSVGVVDNSYRGNNDIWHFPVLYMGDKNIIIPKGTRLCQFQIFKTNQFEIEEVDSLSEIDRGGFGTTGK